MLSRDRQRRIVDAVAATGAASVQELAARLDVSESTIRRDLRILDRNGELERTFGGAVAANTPAGRLPGAEVEQPYDPFNGPDVDLRRQIAHTAATLVRDGDVVLLDIGTTTARLARNLRGRRITVITSSLAVVDELRDDATVELLVLGGILRRNYLSFVGMLTEQALREVRANRLFLGTSGIGPDGRVMDSTLVEVPVKRAMIASAEQTVVLADRGKFPGTGLLPVCGPEDVDVIVTNDGADPATLAACARAGTEIRLA
jgi:DeoR/GlpR family transcriptional regulator of sugar metabolism